MRNLSIIIPIYNAGKSLNRCIDSIQLLNYPDYEVILVDDASKEQREICDEYAAKDSRIRVIHKTENKGAAAARNSGLDIATGEYVLFCDSDDAYDSEKLRKILQTLEKKSDTWNCFSFRNVWPDYVEEMVPYSKKTVLLSSVDQRMDFFSDMKSHQTMGYAVWDKVYLKEYIDRYHIRFPERDDLGNKDDWAEDLSFNLQYGMCVNCVRVDEKQGYLLTKHGTKDQQNENGLINRIDHMMNILVHLSESQVYQADAFCKKQFWKIAIWHMKRYFYLNAGESGIYAMRKLCIQNPHWKKVKYWIKIALKEWKTYGNRWNNVDAADYRYMLEYLVSGNVLKYKLKNYWLWKIRLYFMKRQGKK